MASLLLILSIFQSLRLITAQSCNPSCASNEYCSSFDDTCYSVFTTADYASIVFDWGISGNPFDIFITDNNLTTSVALPGPSNLMTFTFPSNYWVHGMQITVSQELIPSYVRAELDAILFDESAPVSANGIWTYTVTVPTVGNDSFPVTVRNNVTVRLITVGLSGVELYSVDIFGAYSTPQPTEEPTMEPTQQTGSPTMDPSPSPTFSPSMAPTGFPTPDICEDFTVKQSCCGHFDYQIEEDKVNKRDPALTSCTRKILQPCCGNVGTLNLQLNANLTIDRYTCGNTPKVPFENGIDADTVLCSASFFDASLNATDDIFGITMNGSNVLLNNTAGVFSGDIEEWCQCEFVMYECEGEDDAICGSEAKFDELFDKPCWANDTLWTEEDDFSNETCWKETVAEDDSFEHLLWEPCSVDSFLGSVTASYQGLIPSEVIFDGDCSCTYNIRDCHVLEDRTKQCSPSDCENGGECFIESANPCCSAEIDYDYTLYKQGQGVIPDDMLNPQTWTCAANASIPLCPDIFNGERKYTAESRVDWWYDGDAQDIVSRCGCLYTSDECNFPTASPTMSPTQIEIIVTETTVTEENDSRAMRMLVTYSTMIVVVYTALCV